MIVYSKEDTVRLSGNLSKNQWFTIKAAADLLLQDYPQGIIIDGDELENVTEDGAKTFLEAMKDIQGAGARMVVCNLPVNVLEVIRSVPGVRSQLPIANSVEEARMSLRLCGAAPSADMETPTSENAILIPLLNGLDVEYMLGLAGRLRGDGRKTKDHLIPNESKCPVQLVYFLVVSRNLPMGTPLTEEEAVANKMLEQAENAARSFDVPVERHIERVRDPLEGILQAIKRYRAAHVILSASASHLQDDQFVKLLDYLLNRAPCHVLIGRKPLAADGVE